jgi:hypothetical protein
MDEIHASEIIYVKTKLWYNLAACVNVAIWLIYVFIWGDLNE